MVERAVYRADADKQVEDIVIDPFQSPYRPVAKDNGAAQANLELPLDIKQVVQTLEVDLVNKAMAAAKFNQRRAAEQLGLTYHQFRGYLKKYDSERGEP